LTLAMLLPMTSMRIWWFLRPETPANMERIILVRPPVGRSPLSVGDRPGALNEVPPGSADC
jgi:hypothetical protein